MPIRLDQKGIKGLQQKDPQYSKVIKNMKKNSKTVSEEFGLYQIVLYKKIQHHGKEFTVLIVPKALKNCVLYESH